MSFTLWRSELYAVSDFCFSARRVELACSRVWMRERSVGTSVPLGRLAAGMGEPFYERGQWVWGEGGLRGADDVGIFRATCF